MATAGTRIADIQIQLGVNEFEGIAHRYGVVSDCGSIFAPGSLAGADGTNVVLCFDHLWPVGLARLIADPHGIWAHGRICPIVAQGAIVLKMIYSGCVSSLCLSVFPADLSETVFTKSGKPIKRVVKCRPRELSIVLTPGISGCEITRLGPLRLPTCTNEVTDWDQAFFAGLPHLFTIQAEISSLFAQRCKQELSLRPKARMTYEKWFESVRI